MKIDRFEPNQYYRRWSHPTLSGGVQSKEKVMVIKKKREAHNRPLADGTVSFKNIVECEITYNSKEKKYNITLTTRTHEHISLRITAQDVKKKK